MLDILKYQLWYFERVGEAFFQFIVYGIYRIYLGKKQSAGLGLLCIQINWKHFGFTRPLFSVLIL